MTTLKSKHIQIILDYVSLTNYYIVKDTLGSQVTTAM